MTLLQAAVLGVVQGLAEFLPISSSGHLLLVRELLGWPDAGLTFDISLHAGTLLAVLVYFRKTWLELDRALMTKLVVATIPGAVFGALLHHKAETAFRSPALVAINLIVVAVVMELADRYSRRQRGLDGVSNGEALAIGAAQAFAIVPGVSRSGATISAGLALGLTREDAARLSFLMAAPITAGALVKGAHELHKEGVTPGMAGPMLVGAAVSAIVGYFVVAALIRYLATKSLRPFVIYRIAFGLFMLAWSLHRWS